MLVERDDNGRFQAADPDAAADVATKGWVQTENGLLIPRSIVNAKGDLIVGTADDTVVRVPVGAAGTVLQADPGTTEGVSWGKFVPESEGGRNWRERKGIGSMPSVSTSPPL